MDVGIAQIHVVRENGAGALFPLCSGVHLLPLIFVVDRLRYGIPPAARCSFSPLRRVSGIIRVLWIGGRLLAGVRCCPTSTSNGLRNFIRRPIVLVSLNNGNSWVIVDLSDVRCVAKSSRSRSTHFFKQNFLLVIRHIGPIHPKVLTHVTANNVLELTRLNKQRRGPTNVLTLILL